MFLRKLFKVGDKLRWLALELLIVFVGVYLAFLFQSYNEQQKVTAEKEKVLSSLKKETEEFRISFPLNADYQQKKVAEWDSIYIAGGVSEYYNWRYIEPQYKFQVIEYALNLQGTEILDFELYEALLNLYQRIKQLEHTERLMTELGNQYNALPSSLSKSSDTYKGLYGQNRFHFWKFTRFANTRAGILLAVSDLASEVVKMIDDRLDIERQQQIAVELFREFFPSAEGDVAFLREIYQKNFPHYPSELFEAELEKLEQVPQQEN